MVTYTENIDSLRQIYDIRAVNSLAEFLLSGHSLCIIHEPEWRDRIRTAPRRLLSTHWGKHPRHPKSVSTEA